MEITKESVCKQIAEWIAENKLEIYSNAVIIRSNNIGRFSDLIGAYNLLIDNEE